SFEWRRENGSLPTAPRRRDHLRRHPVYCHAYGSSYEMKWNGEHMTRFLDQVVENLSPGYFALVMATGIISVASYQLEMRTIARTLLVINIAAYVMLWSVTLLRLPPLLP